jgi:hypothetical protein
MLIPICSTMSTTTARRLGLSPQPRLCRSKYSSIWVGVELQIPSSPDAADPTLLHPCVQGLGMAVEEGCGLTCSEQVPDSRVRVFMNPNTENSKFL